MDDACLNEVDELLAKTTPGPWPKDYVHEAVRHIARNCDFIESKQNPDFGWDRYVDSEFIAASRTLVPELVAEVRRLRTQLGECYRIAGADTDGADPVVYADHAVAAVRDLRNDYEDSLVELREAQ